MLKIHIKTPKPRNALVAAAKLRGGAGAHQSALSPRVARRAGKHQLQQLLAGRKTRKAEEGGGGGGED